MPPTDKHYQSSLARTGNEHRDVHEWLDSDPEKLAERHDITRIHEYGKMIEEKYGSEARDEYIEHIREDVQVKFTSLASDETAMADALAYFGCGK
ncbi:MAG: hypothetical protein JJD96_06850 [Thermoleophilia bacterium]|nr:hypothetical protein [Thermoleophilia bacterium]